MVTALVGAFALVFVAEAGDKSMLVGFTLAGRYRWWVVAAAFAVESAVAMALVVLLGGVAGSLLPERVTAIGASALFIGFGAWVLVRGAGDDDLEPTPDGRAGAPLITIMALAGTLFLSELGDKTQIATLSLSADHPGAELLIWAGATSGMVSADLLAILAGARVARLAPPHLVARAAGALFVAVGVVGLALALR